MQTLSNQTISLIGRSVLSLSLCAALVGCGKDNVTDDTGTDDTGTDDTSLEVSGVWTDNYGGWTVVDSTTWGSAAVCGAF